MKLATSVLVATLTLGSVAKAQQQTTVGELILDRIKNGQLDPRVDRRGEDRDDRYDRDGRFDRRDSRRDRELQRVFDREVKECEKDLLRARGRGDRDRDRGWGWVFGQNRRDRRDDRWDDRWDDRRQRQRIREICEERVIREMRGWDRR